MDELQKYLVEYRDATLELAKEVEEENYDNLSSIFNRREDIINSIKSLQCDTSEFRQICEELSLQELDSKLGNLLSSKKEEVKEKLKTVSTGKKASAYYNKKNSADWLFLSKKI